MCIGNALYTSGYETRVVEREWVKVAGKGWLLGIFFAGNEARHLLPPGDQSDNPDQLSEQFLSPPAIRHSFLLARLKKATAASRCIPKVEPLSVIYGMGIKEFDQEGRIIGAEFEDFWLINAYFPNGGKGPERLDYKMRFYDAFFTFVEKLREKKPVIFCGDVNTAHEEIDLARPKENEESTGFLPEERAWLDEVIAAGYIDSFRHFHPHTKDAYTYWDTRIRARDRNDGWRIDYFFVSRELIRRIKSASIHPDIFGSDHCPVSITLD